MHMYRHPVSITSADGKRGGSGIVEFARPPLRRRLWKAGILFAIGLAGGVLLLPIPLIHIFGILFFLTMTGFAVKRLVSRRVLKGASGTCPACQAAGDFFVGFGSQRVAFPVSSSCPHCNIGLELWSADRGTGV